MLKTACLVLLLVSLPQCSQSSSSGSTDSASNSKNTEDNDTGKDTTSSTEEVKPCNETTQKLPTKLAIAVVIADPYIECARLCADSNQNGLCDQQEPLSSFSKSDGSAGFSESISPGDRLVLKEKGRHNGVPYKLVLSAIVPSPTALTITQNLFVTPLTTLETLLATPEQIVDILQKAGLTDIAITDVRADPMENVIGNSAPIDDESVGRIRATIATYLFLRIFYATDALRNLTAAEILRQSSPGGSVYQVLSLMVTIIKSSLNNTLLETMQALTKAIPNGPKVTREDVVRTTVAIADRIAQVGTETANTQNNSLAKILSAIQAVATQGNIQAWGSELGQKFYAVRNKDFLEPMKGFLPKTLQEALACPSGTFMINSSNQVECFAS